MKADNKILSELVSQYINQNAVKESNNQKKLREATSHLELSIMQISPIQGQFIRVLLKLINAKKCLEVGTFCGYSALVIAESLPSDGHLITLDINPRWTEYSRPAWQAAGVDNKITLQLGDASQSLHALLETELETFDFIFIDADKTNYSNYYDLSFQLLRKGGIMLIDNIFWDGKVLDDKHQDRQTIAIRELNKKIANDQNIVSTIIPIADGLQLICKN